MSPLREEPRLVAILTADWHIWNKAPVARSNEKDWFEVQKRYLLQLQDIAKTGQKSGMCPLKLAPCYHPIIVAGDIFDRHSPTPETINFLLEHMPRVYAIPGNHDLPHHSLQDIRKSGFWTLVKAGKIYPIENHEGSPTEIGSLSLHAFPYGVPLRPLENPHDMYQEIAVCHEYVWNNDTGYPGAPESSHLSNFRKRAGGYDVVVVGDNHKPFIATNKKPTIVNCGSLLRRTIDQKYYEPRVWKLYSDNKIEICYLDTSEDLPMVNVRDRSEVSVDRERIHTFLRGLQDLSETTVDFEEALHRVLRGVDEGVRKKLLTALEESKR